jgi:two-component system response regulator CpxR
MPRILIVDDDRSILNAMKVLLELEGFEVVVANDGREVFEAISTTPFDVAIVAIVMSRMEGLETLKTFRRHAPGLPVIAVSGLVFRDASSPAPGMSIKLDYTCCLRKPFRPRDLINAIFVRLGGDHEAGVKTH